MKSVITMFSQFSSACAALLAYMLVTFGLGVTNYAMALQEALIYAAYYFGLMLLVGAIPTYWLAKIIIESAGCASYDYRKSAVVGFFQGVFLTYVTNELALGSHYFSTFFEKHMLIGLTIGHIVASLLTVAVAAGIVRIGLSFIPNKKFIN